MSSSISSAHEPHFEKWLRVINSCKWTEVLWDALTPYETRLSTVQKHPFYSEDSDEWRCGGWVRDRSAFRAGLLFSKARGGRSGRQPLHVQPYPKAARARPYQGPQARAPPTSGGPKQATRSCWPCNLLLSFVESLVLKLFCCYFVVFN